MIIPWGTDAPIYHRPFATIALIAINVLLLFIVPREAYQDYVLLIGDGVHPVQWLTNNFLHSGIVHLVGNMIFLWTFGLLVEGKLGWWKFTIVYLLLGVVDSALMQLLVPSEHPIRMLGSSTIIFGLMGMCLVWAPRNEVTCIVWLRFTPMEFDLSILWFAAMYITLDVLTGGMSGVLRASLTNLSPAVIVAMALDHTVGAILGMIVGAVMVKLSLVDCENWDLFAVLERRAGKPKSKEPRTKRAASPGLIRVSSLRRNGGPVDRRSPGRAVPSRSRTVRRPCCVRCASISSSKSPRRLWPFTTRHGDQITSGSRQSRNGGT